MNDHRRIAALAAFGVFVGLSLFVVLCLALAAHVQPDLGRETGRRLVRFDLYVTIFGCLTLAVLLVVMVFVGITDALAGRDRSRLYLPVIALSFFLFSILAISSVRAFDLLAHDLRPRWTYLSSITARLITLGLYLGMIGAVAWFLAAVLRGRGLSWRAVALCYLGVAAVVIVIVVLASLVQTAGVAAVLVP